uniref:Uncharacterized protein n=1 Tax=Rhizophora mucronata TaxID=61149 RepID=A0A2P2MWK6_RHIMU
MVIWVIRFKILPLFLFKYNCYGKNNGYPYLEITVMVRMIVIGKEG